MIKFIKYWWNKILLWITKLLKRSDYDNKVFANFVNNKVVPKLSKVIEKNRVKGEKDYLVEIDKALSIVLTFMKLDNILEAKIKKHLQALKLSSKQIAKLIGVELIRHYNKNF